MQDAISQKVDQPRVDLPKGLAKSLIQLSFRGGGVMDRDARLADMIRIADHTGFSLDEVDRYLGRCSESWFRAVADNPSILPRYIKSNVKP